MEKPKLLPPRNTFLMRCPMSIHFALHFASVWPGTWILSNIFSNIIKGTRWKGSFQRQGRKSVNGCSLPFTSLTWTITKILGKRCLVDMAKRSVLDLVWFTFVHWLSSLFMYNMCGTTHFPKVSRNTSATQSIERKNMHCFVAALHFLRYIHFAFTLCLNSCWAEHKPPTEETYPALCRLYKDSETSFHQAKASGAFQK